MTEKQKKAAEAYERNKEKKKLLGEEHLTTEDRKERRKAYQRAYAKQWREAHPEYMKRYMRTIKQRTTDPKWREYQRQYQRAWRENHPDYFKNWRKRKIEETRRKLNETKNEKRERIRKSLPIEARKALAALEKLKNKKKEQRQE